MVLVNNNMTAAQFNREMTKWALLNVPKIGKLVHEAVATTVYEGIVTKTPVLTGRARNNWFPTNGTPSSASVEETAGVSITGESMTGEETARIKAVTRKLKGLELGAEEVFITNNQPYIQPLEDGTISKKSPPAAMVEGTIINTLDGLKVDIVLKGIN